MYYLHYRGVPTILIQCISWAIKSYHYSYQSVFPWWRRSIFFKKRRTFKQNQSLIPLKILNKPHFLIFYLIVLAFFILLARNITKLLIWCIGFQKISACLLPQPAQIQPKTYYDTLKSIFFFVFSVSHQKFHLIKIRT